MNHGEQPGVVEQGTDPESTGEARVAELLQAARAYRPTRAQVEALRNQMAVVEARPVPRSVFEELALLSQKLKHLL